jgi:hypothetical protein
MSIRQISCLYKRLKPIPFASSEDILSYNHPEIQASRSSKSLSISSFKRNR